MKQYIEAVYQCGPCNITCMYQEVTHNDYLDDLKTVSTFQDYHKTVSAVC